MDQNLGGGPAPLMKRSRPGVAGCGMSQRVRTLEAAVSKGTAQRILGRMGQSFVLEVAPRSIAKHVEEGCVDNSEEKREGTNVCVNCVERQTYKCGA